MKNPQNLRLSVVMPFYNEKNNIDLLLHKYKTFVKTYNFELICVNNGSTDGSEEVFAPYLTNKQYSFLTMLTIKKNIGYGYGIITGVKRAKGDLIAWTHADMQTDPSDVFRAYEIYIKQSNPNSLVKGSRVGRPVIDTIVSLFMGIIATILLRAWMYEINAQPKLFPKSLVKELTDSPHDILLDLYLLYIARKNRYNIKSFGVTFHKRLYGKSKWAFSYQAKLKMIQRTISYLFFLHLQKAS